MQIVTCNKNEEEKEKLDKYSYVNSDMTNI